MPPCTTHGKSHHTCLHRDYSWGPPSNTWSHSDLWAQSQVASYPGHMHSVWPGYEARSQEVAHTVDQLLSQAFPSSSFWPFTMFGHSAGWTCVGWACVGWVCMGWACVGWACASSTVVFFIACRGQTMHVALTNIQEEVYDFKDFPSDAMWYKSGHWNWNAGVGIILKHYTWTKKRELQCIGIGVELFQNVALWQ